MCFTRTGLNGAWLRDPSSQLAFLILLPILTVIDWGLKRKFRASLGRTIAEEITRLRLERAKRRLVETEAPLKEIALSAGFPTANHFTKVFSRVEGISPTQYRLERKQSITERGG
jgi:AraC-like DNA-binding protein